MKILIISGFLGAGKTTFIKALRRHTKKEYVILENEYGDVDIDTAVLERDNMKVWELTEGCICCSVKADFANSVLTISNTLDPDYLIVEPSGVGMLSNIYTNIKKIQYARIRLLAPITLIDFHSFHEYMDTFDAFYKDQIINAGRVLIAKGERAPSEELLSIGKMLKALNPKGEIVTDHYENQPDWWWQSILITGWDEDRGIVPLAEDCLEMSSLSFKDVSYDDFEQFQWDMTALMDGRLGKIYRIKGFLPIEGQWAKVDVVNKQYNLEIWDARERARIVIIGRDLDRSSLTTLFKSRSK
ncbi:MAG: CobW family GTP-binding protein [Anaerovoracaceae bacterium]|jgi:G3E family GTPase